LCQRAFLLTPEEVIARLEGKIAEGRLINDGAYIIATCEIVGLEEARRLNDELRPLLSQDVYQG
jgi:hypothetical protein